jgi:hypothetical protein
VFRGYAFLGLDRSRGQEANDCDPQTAQEASVHRSPSDASFATSQPERSRGPGRCPERLDVFRTCETALDVVAYSTRDR